MYRHRGRRHRCLRYLAGQDAAPALRQHEQQAASQDDRAKHRVSHQGQAYALSPTLPETISGYTSLLLQLNRPDEAFLLAKTSLRLDPDSRCLVRGEFRVAHDVGRETVRLRQLGRPSAGVGRDRRRVTDGACREAVCVANWARGWRVLRQVGRGSRGR